jgi:hypothetical protein
MNDNVIKNPVPKNFQKTTSPSNKPKNGVIGTPASTVKQKENIQPKKSKEEKVAIHSSRSVNWPGVGEVRKGYNIIPKNKLDQWLSRDHVREATPEEVAEEFGL